MLEAFRLEVAHISLSINCDEDNENTEGGLRYHPKANEFVQLRTRVSNLMRMYSYICHNVDSAADQECAAYPVVFTLDYEANPSEHLVFEGVLTELPVGRLESGESREIVSSLCFLACGRFEILAKARSYGASEADSRVARTHVIAIVKGDT